MDGQNDDKMREIEELRNRMMKENMFLNSLHNKNMSVYFNAYRYAMCFIAFYFYFLNN